MRNCNVPLWYCHNVSTSSKSFAFLLKNPQHLVYNDTFPQSIAVKYNFQHTNTLCLSCLVPVFSSFWGWIYHKHQGGYVSTSMSSDAEGFCHMKGYQPHNLTLQSITVAILGTQRWSWLYCLQGRQCPRGVKVFLDQITQLFALNFHSH